MQHVGSVDVGLARPVAVATLHADMLEGIGCCMMNSCAFKLNKSELALKIHLPSSFT